MTVKRIVANLVAPDPAQTAQFYRDLFGLEVAMDQGFIVTLKSSSQMTPQISFANEGGSGTEVPDLSIEVDDIEATLVRANELGCRIEYGPVTEPWGVRRFYVRDPAGRLLNILMHLPENAAS